MIVTATVYWVQDYASLDEACHQFHPLILCVQTFIRLVFQTAFNSHPSVPYVL